MDHSVKNLINIKNNINSKLEILKINKYPNIIAVSKTFKLERILPLINYGHHHYGENKVQEAIEKWSEIKKDNPKIKLHMIGKLQTNKVKFAVKVFDYIHSVDSFKLAEKIATEQKKLKKNIKIFIQVNLVNELQKSGINKNDLSDLIDCCKTNQLDIMGLMCIPPLNFDPNIYFKEMQILNQSFNFDDLSMGMSSDYLKATEHSSTYLRIGSDIFGKRS
jgi:pyridoxal phosphate enzyme (YggS family)